ncbi:MAG TPA: hypothetical protein VN649_19550 [Ramlibacter sp.]|nr:hypothetical protein [Ramlibacter sp.]
MSANKTVACFSSAQAKGEAACFAVGNVALISEVPQPPQNLALGMQMKPHAAHMKDSAPPQFSQKRFESGFAV